MKANALFLILFLFASNSFATQLSIEVAGTKEDGRAWDGGFGAEKNPDIAICLSDGSNTRCYPDGSSKGLIMASECRNSFSCLFNVTIEPGKMYTLSVIDVDVSNNDLIGEGTIMRGIGGRQMGQAYIILGE